jgi:(1->4)-alpha-D-glucan 1-alpha-D-glucosylmutase
LYLRQLGISHCYASPYLKARPGNSHGYDIVDHNELNPESGNHEDFERFIGELQRRKLSPSNWPIHGTTGYEFA